MTNYYEQIEIDSIERPEDKSTIPGTLIIRKESRADGGQVHFTTCDYDEGESVDKRDAFSISQESLMSLCRRILELWDHDRAMTSGSVSKELHARLPE